MEIIPKDCSSEMIEIIKAVIAIQFLLRYSFNLLMEYSTGFRPFNVSRIPLEIPGTLCTENNYAKHLLKTQRNSTVKHCCLFDKQSKQNGAQRKVQGVNSRRNSKTDFQTRAKKVSYIFGLLVAKTAADQGLNTLRNAHINPKHNNQHIGAGGKSGQINLTQIFQDNSVAAEYGNRLADLNDKFGQTPQTHLFHQNLFYVHPLKSQDAALFYEVNK